MATKDLLLKLCEEEEEEEEVVVNLLNDVIEEAIYHGGDIGGAYYSNNDDLIKSVNLFLERTGLSERWQTSEIDQYGQFAAHSPAIVRKEKVVK